MTPAPRASPRVASSSRATAESPSGPRSTTLAPLTGAEFRICELDDAHGVDLGQLGQLVDRRTKVVAFGHVSNALGTINPVERIVRIARGAAPDALVVCDGAQAVPHLGLNIDALGVDAYAFSGHKIGGPMGIGGVAVRRAILEAMHEERPR